MSVSSPFTIFPAIDLLDGKSVRLNKGQRDTAHIVAQSPLDQMLMYQDLGATHIHIVNLNAAFGDADNDPDMLESVKAIERIAKNCSLKIELGGGIRSEKAVKNMLDVGAWRVIVGTWAVREKEECLDVVSRYQDRIVLGLDTIGGKIATHGWESVSEEPLLDFAQSYKEAGVQTALFTVVERDGMLTGFTHKDIVQMETVAAASGLDILASGGVRDNKDIQALAQSKGIAGVVLGKAIHAGTINLKEALALQRS